MAVRRYYNPRLKPSRTSLEEATHVAQSRRRLCRDPNAVRNNLVIAAAADIGTAEEAKAMLERAVAEVKEDKAKALDLFNTGEGGFKDRDLYVWCANASDGILTAHPYGYKGKQLRDIKGYHGAPFGETIVQNATEGAIKQTTYWWPRPGTEVPLEKTTVYTKVGDQICGVGFYKD
jgi:hypothetical protein